MKNRKTWTKQSKTSKSTNTITERLSFLRSRGLPCVSNFHVCICHLVFLDLHRKLEDTIIDAVVEQSEVIFGSTMTKEELLPMFNSNVKESPGREPKFRIKVDTNVEEQIKANVFDGDKNPKKDEVTNGLYARNSGHAIVELNSVYFLNRKFGCTWKLHQLIVYEPQNLKGFQFII